MSESEVEYLNDLLLNIDKELSRLAAHLINILKWDEGEIKNQELVSVRAYESGISEIRERLVNRLKSINEE